MPKTGGFKSSTYLNVFAEFDIVEKEITKQDAVSFVKVSENFQKRFTEFCTGVSVLEDDTSGYIDEEKQIVCKYLQINDSLINETKTLTNNSKTARAKK